MVQSPHNHKQRAEPPRTQEPLAASPMDTHMDRQALNAWKTLLADLDLRGLVLAQTFLDLLIRNPYPWDRTKHRLLAATTAALKKKTDRLQGRLPFSDSSYGPSQKSSESCSSKDSKTDSKPTQPTQTPSTGDEGDAF